jgi:hypothetical protein
MIRAIAIGLPLVIGLSVAVSFSQPPPAPAAAPGAPGAPAPVAEGRYSEAGFHAGAAGMNPSERAGREIWYKATVGNDRFHTYVFQQRIGVLIDWYRVLNSDSREERFKTWGLINDPGCCKPGSEGCPAKSLEETYGFDWCVGDEVLLNHVGKSGYRDPACDFKEAPVAADDPHGAQDQRQSACDLKFGTSTGALGLRKFPNPRFDAEKWRKLNGGKSGTWEGYNKRLSQSLDASDSRVSHLLDGSIEPPFLVGMSCGACHIAFDPLNPPKDTASPKWENIKGLVGNQYSRFSEIMVSGMPTDTLEWQVFAHARPGTSDTSAVPTDQVNNPGTINALINVKQRPTFENEEVMRWRKVKSCNAGEAETACWCEPGKPGKCWRRGLERETVHHILKDGSDSIGILGAIQRVYFNIGSCSEQCWVNHLTDLRQLDPQQRGYGQTPFDIGQCRRDCPNFRAMEDRLENVRDFLLSSEAHAADLHVARANTLKLEDPNSRYQLADLIDDLEKEFGRGSVARGKEVFGESCARCHSSQKSPSQTIDFHAVSMQTGLRTDWLGNDQSTKVSEVGTFRCRALHSNHMKGHVWEQFASETYRARPADTVIPEPNGGGRGYYRNISLLNLWAHAPFMHNNAMGPELCGWEGAESAEKRKNFYRNSYVNEKGELLPNPPACSPYDPSVEGRFKLYKASMQELLNPSARVPKSTRLNQNIVIDLGPKLWDGEGERRVFGFTLTIPQGANAGVLGNFQHKPFVVDLVQSKTKPKELEERLVKQLGEAEGKKLAAEMSALADEIINAPEQMIDTIKKRPHLARRVYSSCFADIENGGHPFGQDLSEADKKALTAFLATL